MFRVVLFAFARAGVANFCAQRADPRRELAAAGHQTHCESANVGAIAIELDAASHHLHVLFVQALRRAAFACDDATDAGMHTTLVFLV